MSDFAAEGDLQRYLAWLVSRAYAEIHETRERQRVRPWRWFLVDFPIAFRRQIRAFQFAVVLTIAGAAFGGFAIQHDPEAKNVLMPFEGLRMTPAQRVAREREGQGRQLAGNKDRFSAQLITHNTQVAFTTLALGITFGLGTLIVLFYNGVILGAVALDYIMGGQTVFLLGWLLPHGVIEIPAILIGGQAGLVIAQAMIGWGDRLSRAERMRRVSGDVAMLACGVAVLLVWAGLVEAGIYLAVSRAGVTVRYQDWIRSRGGTGADRVSFPRGPGTEQCTMTRAETLSVRTPEGVTFRLLLAGPFHRMTAFLIDFCVIAAAEQVFGVPPLSFSIFGRGRK